MTLMAETISDRSVAAAERGLNGCAVQFATLNWLLPLRGAWIEIRSTWSRLSGRCVAPRERGLKLLKSGDELIKTVAPRGSVIKMLVSTNNRQSHLYVARCGSVD